MQGVPEAAHRGAVSDIEMRARKADILALQGDRDSAIADYLRILADVDAGDGYFREAELRVGLADLLRGTGDPRQVQQLTKAAALFEKRGDLRGQIDTCLRMADLHRSSEVTAIYWADRAVKAAQKSERPADLRLPLAIRGELLLAFDRVAEALSDLRTAVRLPGGNVHADALASAQIRAGDVEDGLATLTQALAEAEQRDGPEDARTALFLKLRLADAKRALDDKKEAMRLLEDAADQIGALPVEDDHSLILDRLGFALLESGDPAAAVDVLERGIEQVRGREPSRPGPLASLYHNLGNALASLGNQAGSVRAFTAAVDLARQVGNLRSEALIRFGLANVLVQIGDHAGARQSYDEARGLAVRMGHGSLEAACLDSLGQIHSQAGEPARALDLHRRAARLHELENDFTGQHTDLMNLVQALLLLDETAAARRSMDEATGVARAHLEELPWQHSLMEGQVLAREGRWPDAREAFNSAIQTVERQRSALETPNDQRRWAARRVEAFEIAAACAFQAEDARGALTYLEGNRARFLDAVAAGRRRLPQGLPPETQQAYAAATNRLAGLRWRRRQHPELVDEELEAELEEAKGEWRRLDHAVESLRMGAAEAHGVSGPTVSAPLPEDLAACLSPGEAAVAIHVTTEWTGAACVGRGRDGALWWTSETGSALTLADLSRLVVGRVDGDERLTSPAWRELAALDDDEAQRLVATTCALLGEGVWPLIERAVGDRADALVLMPGRGLNVLPLHAAVTSSGTLALDRWTIRYAPSLRLLARAGDPGVLPPDRVLGQAVNPTEDLPLARTEAKALRRSWGGESLEPIEGKDARAEQVLSLFERSDTLHFAGHAGFDPDDPLQSRLQCAGEHSTGVFTLQTLLESVPRARARMVLLSACETGRVQAADPLNDQLGLPGGLLIAGSSAVLASFWYVDDLASCLLLDRCIAVWEEGSLELAQALARAQSWLRSKATVRVGREWIEEQMDLSDATNGRTDGQLESFYDLILQQNEDDRLLFADEVSWAPFHVSGRAMYAG